MKLPLVCHVLIDKTGYRDQTPERMGCVVTVLEFFYNQEDSSIVAVAVYNDGIIEEFSLNQIQALTEEEYQVFAKDPYAYDNLDE